MKIFFSTLLMILTISCSKGPEDRGVMYFGDMVFSPAVEAYTSSDLTKNGQAMMDPVKGSIARGKMPYHLSKSEEDSIKAGNEIVNPIPVTDKTLARGEYLYHGFCAECHGATGEGDGPIISKKFPAPPSLKSTKLKTYTEGRLFHIITVGFGDMPAHGEQIAIQDRWYITHFIKRIQQ